MLPIRLLAPSYGCEKEQLLEVASFLTKEGFDVSYSCDFFQKDPFSSAPKEIREKDFKEALLLKEPHILWPIAGGYGAMDVLSPALLELKSPPHILVGFSDITCLHGLFNGVYNLSSIHGCCARHLVMTDKSELTKVSVLDLLKTNTIHQVLEVKPLNAPAFEKDSFEGDIIGGNLTLVQCCLSTPWGLNPKGKILYLEEVDERGYRVDRLFLHLFQTGFFEELKALILGDFTEGLEPDGSCKIDIALKRWCQRLDLPIYHLPDTGHGKVNKAFWLNKKTTIIAKK